MTPRKILHFAIGPLVGALLGVFTLPIITWSFSQDDVGRFSMLQVTLSFGVLLFSLGLDQAYVREFHESSDRPGLLKLVMLPGMVLLVLVMLCLCALGPKLADWLFGVPQWQLSLLVAVALLVNYTSRFLSLVLRMTERGLAFSMSQILPKLLLLCVIGTYFLFDSPKSLRNLVLANTLALITVMLIFAWNTRDEWRTAIHRTVGLEQLKPLLGFGLPLILGGLAFWGLTAVDRFFLRWLSNYEQLAIYSVSASVAAAAAVLQSVFSTVWAPTVYKWSSEGEGFEKVIEVMRYVLLCVVILFCLAGLFSWVVPFILPRDYQEVRWVLVSCLGFPLLYTLSETTVVGIGLSRRSSFAMLAAIIAFIVNVVGNWYLIPLFGASGAAASTCISFFIFMVLRTEFSAFLWQNFPRRCLYIYCFSVVTGSVCTTLWGQMLGGWTYIFWLCVLMSTFIFFRQEFSQVRSMLCRSA